MSGVSEPDDSALDAYVDRLVAAAPPLSDEQRTRLAELLHPVRDVDVGSSERPTRGKPVSTSGVTRDANCCK